MRGNEVVAGARIKCYRDDKAGPGAWDIYSVMYVDVPENDGCVACVGLSGHASGKCGPHLGKRIAFADLPEHLQRTVLADCKEIAAAEG